MLSTRWPGSWHRISITIPAASEELVLAKLQLSQSRGAISGPAGPGRLMLSAWFDGEAFAEAALASLLSLPGTRDAGEGVLEESDTGWMDASLNPRDAIRAGRFLVLDRDEESPQDRDTVSVVIPLGRAFGTGEHETTHLCLELLDEHIKPGARVFDLGTGSGILAVAAAKAEAESVLAMDNDPAVIEVAEENVRLNGCASCVSVAAGSYQDLPSGTHFDLVLANIHRSALVKAAAAISSRLQPRGVAIVSGFSPEDATLVIEAWASHGFQHVEQREDGEWCALALSRGEE